MEKEANSRIEKSEAHFLRSYTKILWASKDGEREEKTIHVYKLPFSVSVLCVVKARAIEEERQPGESAIYLPVPSNYCAVMLRQRDNNVFFSSYLPGLIHSIWTVNYLIR